MPKTIAVTTVDMSLHMTLWLFDYFKEPESHQCQLFIEYDFNVFGSIYTSNLHGARHTQQKDTRLPAEWSAEAQGDGGLTLLMLNYSGL